MANAAPVQTIPTEEIQRVRVWTRAVALGVFWLAQSPRKITLPPPLLLTQLLEENYVFIKAIVDQQNLGRLPQMAE